MEERSTLHRGWGFSALFKTSAVARKTAHQQIKKKERSAQLVRSRVFLHRRLHPTNSTDPMLISFSFVLMIITAEPFWVQGAPGSWALKVNIKAKVCSQAASAEVWGCAGTDTLLCPLLHLSLSNQRGSVSSCHITPWLWGSRAPGLGSASAAGVSDQVPAGSG